MLSENIFSLIPQRPPFVMIDALTYVDEKTGRSTLQVKGDNIFVEKGLLTEPALMENIAQTAAARIGYICQAENRPVPLGYIGAIQNLEITALPKINDTLETEIIIKNQIFEVTVISGRVQCNETVLVTCEMKIFIPKQS
jgi:predicted hotdog family 3-hydroxylacyl-ACP dehydratase